ncbi:MAG: sulfite exporter TauE/SafE family protein [Planctomycetota bacterium]
MDVDLSPALLGGLAVFSVLTSLISAVLGEGGGILLLAAMYSFLPLTVVVPLHGAIQLVSNSSRVLAYWKEVRWVIVGRYLAGGLITLLPAWFLVTWVASGTDPKVEAGCKTLIGFYILWLTHRRKGGKNAGKGQEAPGFSGFVPLGACVVPVSMVFGATGPLLAPFFIRPDLNKEEVVSTKAACQMATHSLKLLVFLGATSFPYKEATPALLLLGIGAVVGTFAGRKVMEKLSEALFRKLYVVALTVAGFKILLMDGVLGLLN